MWAVSKKQSEKGLSIDGQCGQLVRDRVGRVSVLMVSVRAVSNEQSGKGLSIDGQCGQLVMNRVGRVSVLMVSVGS